MKRIVLFCVFLFIVSTYKCNAEQNIVLDNYNEMEINNVFEIAQDTFPGFDGEAIVKNLTLGKFADTGSIVKTIKEYVFEYFYDLLKIFILIVLTGYIISIIEAASQAFCGGTSKNALIVGYFIFAGVLIAVFAELITPARETIENLLTMIKSTIPVLVTLLTLSGGITTAGFVSPLLISLINVIASILGDFLISVAMATVSLSVADRMSDRINIASAVKSLKQFVKWVLLFCMAIYSGLYGVYGLAGSALDNRIGKAARFAVGSSVPVVGNVVSDSIETIIGTVSALRSITGVVGIIAICAVAALPLIKIAMVMWMFRLSAVILEPVSDAKIVKLTADVAESTSMIFAILTSVSLLLIGCIGIILLSGNFIS